MDPLHTLLFFLSIVVFPIFSLAKGPCTVTSVDQLAKAISSCTNLTLSNIHAPAGVAIELVNLSPGTTVVFEGRTTIDHYASRKFVPIVVRNAAGVTIRGASGSVIDGSGPLYWDSRGSNGGAAKPDHFFELRGVHGGSVVEDLVIRNFPTHGVQVHGCRDVTFRRLTLDTSDGDAPNARSHGKPAGHNTDGFGISGASGPNVRIEDSVVTNQDDCVAVKSARGVTVRRVSCRGLGHGLSIGSVGGHGNSAADNEVTDVLFENSEVVGGDNGVRIKTNYGTVGRVANITYRNVALSGIRKYGVVLQQDYLNSGPTGTPSNGVVVEDIFFEGVKGTTAGGKAIDYYVLCGKGSCKNVVFKDTHITGGGRSSSCNYPPSGCPGP